ncbi:MAG: glycerol kinase GlpK [Sphingobacteriales bacterium]|nr:MAG: glycerol kinase GlpK [Sphingobacteriales bacterium]
MSYKKYILAIDQGTSSTKSLIFDEQGLAIAKGAENLHTHYLANGFVEQEPEVIYQNVLASVQKCLQQFIEKGFQQSDIACIGISNQRETFVVWDENGKPLYNAVVWQCKRSVQVCEELKQLGMRSIVQQKTGLVIDPYFSATKLIWLNQQHELVRNAIKNKKAFFGTIDTWLLYKLTNGSVYATDYTNASRTLLFNLHTLQWDADLIDAFGLTGIQLPSLKPSAANFGSTTLNDLLPAAIPVTAMIGDSHAAAFGEGCFAAGTAKATLGTGCSILMNIGSKPVASANGMVTTICWSMEGRVDYALEGLIVSCGAAIEWLKNELNLFINSNETEAMATAVTDNGGVYLIPAFSGLGSPHWQMDRKASIHGLSFGSNKKHIVRAGLEAIAYQVKDVVVAMEKDAELFLKELNIDGGMTANQWLMQQITDLVEKKVNTIGMTDVSALGAGLLAGLQLGFFESITQLQQLLNKNVQYHPTTGAAILKGYDGWLKLVQA